METVKNFIIKNYKQIKVNQLSFITILFYYFY